MEEQNPYRSPESAITDVAVMGDANLAGRGERFGASLIDGLIMGMIIFPLMFVGGYWTAVMTAASEGHQVDIGTMLLWGVIGFAVLVVVQGIPLHASGQTWGKKMLGIKIVDLSGAKPSLGRLLGLRYLPLQVIANIPVVGPLAMIVDPLLIFRDDRRCGHDLIAGTQVVKAE